MSTSDSTEGVQQVRPILVRPVRLEEGIVALFVGGIEFPDDGPMCFAELVESDRSATVYVGESKWVCTREQGHDGPLHAAGLPAEDGDAGPRAARVWIDQ